MKVTVIVITYNHEHFIAQALDSVLTQETKFPFEVIVSEDCSTDATRDIIIDFKERYPSRIRLLLSERNLNTNHVLTRGIDAAQGDYIALLDGDDYWTSPHKLQKQVDFLDEHNECAICFHQAYNLYSDGRTVLYSEDVNYRFDKDRFTLEDILCQNFLPTCSVVFRKGLFEEFPGSFYDTLAADWFLHVLNARYGNIGYINENWGVRRVHEGGVVSMKSDKEILELRIRSIEAMCVYLNFGYKHANERLLFYQRRYVRLLLQEGKFRNATVEAFRVLRTLAFSSFSPAPRLFQNLNRLEAKS
jgi:glycosyltransferase involved in cell wall biosynthesis